MLKICLTHYEMLRWILTNHHKIFTIIWPIAIRAVSAANVPAVTMMMFKNCSMMPLKMIIVVALLLTQHKIVLILLLLLHVFCERYGSRIRANFRPVWMFYRRIVCHGISSCCREAQSRSSFFSSLDMFLQMFGEISFLCVRFTTILADMCFQML